MKRVAIWLCVTVVLAAAILFAVPWFLSRGVVKERVAAQLSALTGKQVQLNGESSVSLWPFLRVSYHDVVVGGSLVLADLPPLVRMDGLDARLSLASAFWGETRLSQVTLVRPRFSLQINTEGTDNWTIREGPLADRLRQPSEAEALDIGTLQIVNGIADYIDMRRDISAQLTDINGTIAWPDTSSTGTANVSAVWRGEVVKLTAEIDSPFDLLRGKVSQLTMNLLSKPVNLSYSGDAMLGDTPVANGKMTAICPSPRRLLEWTGQTIPVVANVAETFIEGNVTARTGTIEFQDANVRFGEHEGTGRLQVQTAGKDPLVSGTLAFKTLWLPNPASLALQDADITPTGKLDLSFLKGFGLDLRLSASTATLEPFEITDMAAAAIVRDGSASFEIGEAQALGGQMAGSISFSEGKGVGLFATDLSLNAVELEQLTTLYGSGELALEGVGNARFRLRSTGTSARGLLINLDGDGMIDGKAGSIKGVDLQDLPLDVTGSAEGPTSPFSGVTPYDELSIKFSVTNGSAFFDGSSMASGSMAVSLGGQVDLLRRSLALRGEMTRQFGDKATSSPFFVGGNTTAPLFAMLPKSGPKPLKSR
ncbi:MAG: AsmA family protein [Rhizobiaceae bacterium]